MDGPLADPQVCTAHTSQSVSIWTNASPFLFDSFSKPRPPNHGYLAAPPGCALKSPPIITNVRRGRLRMYLVSCFQNSSRSASLASSPGAITLMTVQSWRWPRCRTASIRPGNTWWGEQNPSCDQVESKRVNPLWFTPPDRS